MQKSSDKKNLSKILIIDDEQSILDVIRILLTKNGFTVATASSGKEGIELIKSFAPDIVITDIRMPDISGVDVLAKTRAYDFELPVVLMTAQASLQSAMQAVNEGAFYYIQKPFRNDELLTIIHRAIEHRTLKAENRTLKQEIRRQKKTGRPVGLSDQWLSVLNLTETVAPTDSTILLQGESGTGKEVIARYIHERSARATGPFLSINCGALPESLLESELFGHVKGAFTGAIRDKAGLFAAAEKGTFFLDEVGEMSPATQVKILRALQNREITPVGSTESISINTRVIAATNRDLEYEVRIGRFRSDLFYRLNVIAVHLPPLRERRQDIPLLSEAILNRTDPNKTLTPEALRFLCDYNWPGNVRELENALERAVIVTHTNTIDPSSLPDSITQPKTTPLINPLSRQHHTPTLEIVEHAYIKWILESHSGNKTKTAEVLGIDPSTLHRKLQRIPVTL